MWYPLLYSVIQYSCKRYISHRMLRFVVFALCAVAAMADIYGGYDDYGYDGGYIGGHGGGYIGGGYGHGIGGYGGGYIKGGYGHGGYGGVYGGYGKGISYGKTITTVHHAPPVILPSIHKGPIYGGGIIGGYPKGRPGKDQEYFIKKIWHVYKIF